MISRLIYQFLQDHQHFPFYSLSSCTNRCLHIAEIGHFIWSFPSREIYVYGCLNELQNDKVGLTPRASIKYLTVSSPGSQFMLLMTKTLFTIHRSDYQHEEVRDVCGIAKMMAFRKHKLYLPAGHRPWSWDNRWNAKQRGNDVQERNQVTSPTIVTIGSATNFPSHG